MALIRRIEIQLPNASVYSSESILWDDGLVQDVVRCIKEFAGLKKVKLRLEDSGLVDDEMIAERVRKGADELGVDVGSVRFEVEDRTGCSHQDL